MRVVATLIPATLLIAAVASYFGLLLQDVVESMRISGVLIILASISAIGFRLLLAANAGLSHELRSPAAFLWMAFALGGLVLIAFPVPAACAMGLLKESCA
jgi:hypothetical protein